jgi:hypothetical protein
MQVRMSKFEVLFSTLKRVDVNLGGDLCEDKQLCIQVLCCKDGEFWNEIV